MKTKQVWIAQYALLAMPFPILVLTVGFGSALAVLTTFAVPLLIMGGVAVWELKAYPY
ncbi:hypothetical protein ACWDX6_23875 [Streptomyces sp. NPDC003027]